ncbi:MAG: hypothetical protein OJI74_08280 [Rhodanobacter thiooxydans]|nr:hypothetical protein [Rhodanobacter thiooxydans]MCW0201851.1 hypothetical protein [Rhodanobacter thiooxydans]
MATAAAAPRQAAPRVPKRPRLTSRHASPVAVIQPHRESSMSKGMDTKKDEKKKPAKTLKEKRAAKQEKKKSTK